MTPRAPVADRSARLITQDEVVEPQFLRRLARHREEAGHQAPEGLGPEAVVVVLPLASRLDQPGDPQERQVVADGGLSLPETLAEVGDVELARSRQKEKDAEP